MSFLNDWFFCQFYWIALLWIENQSWHLSFCTAASVLWVFMTVLLMFAYPFCNSTIELMLLLVWMIGPAQVTIFVFVCLNKIGVPSGLMFGEMAFSLTPDLRHKLHWAYTTDDDIALVPCSSTAFILSSISETIIINQMSSMLTRLVCKPFAMNL